jgi:hypothetical protein
MATREKRFKTIDEYIGTFPKNVQSILQELRQVIKDAAPKAEEAISYQIPTFKLDGNLVWFAAFKEVVRRYADVGFSEFMFFHPDTAPVIRSRALKEIASGVMPELRREVRKSFLTNDRAKN